MSARVCVTLLASAVLAACSGDDPDPSPEAWQEAFDASNTGWLLSVWGPAGDDLYAVGGAPDAGVIMRFDGTAWSEVALGMDVPLLNWVYGFGPNDITVVGNGGTILHYDGASWTAQTTTTTEDLWGVWGAAPDDLWAVGGRGRGEGQDTVLHYDGSAWTKIATPELTRPNVFAFFKVWAPRRTTSTWSGSAGPCCTTTAPAGRSNWSARARI